MANDDVHPWVVIDKYTWGGGGGRGGSKAIKLHYYTVENQGSIFCLSFYAPETSREMPKTESLHSSLSKAAKSSFEDAQRTIRRLKERISESSRKQSEEGFAIERYHSNSRLFSEMLERFFQLLK